MRRAPEESTVPRPVATPVPAPSVPPEASGRRLGRYQLLFELARGGIGTVYVGRLTGAHGFDRLVAIKRLSAPSSGDDEVSSFLDEARLTARINHPNVVQTLELGDDDGAPFLVMQLVEGVSLARLLRRLADAGEVLDHDLASWIVAQAATGLHAAHELRSVDGEPYGIVHRDVSPENVLLSYDGRVYVADFGVAKFAGDDRATRSGVVKGKFAYMSPEQTRAGVLDRRSDVFSLGVVLHEALTGRRLFAGSSPADTIRRIGEDIPPSPRNERPDIPDALVAIAARCLEKRREDRFATAGEVAESLRRHLRERGAHADETDLARLLEGLFSADRDRLRDRIRESVGATPSARTARELSEERELTQSVAGQSGHGSVTAAIRPARQKTSRLIGTGAVLLIAALGAAIWVARVGRDAPAAPPSATPASTTTAPSPGPPPPPSPTAEATSATAAPTASAAPAPPPQSRLPPASRATSGVAQPPPTAPTPAPPPSVTPSSQRGVPFRRLD